jgi:hypothetical protein
MSVTASRLLLDKLTPNVNNVFVLHDFDISGFSICGTLGTNNRRYFFENDPPIIDLGLRLTDVLGMRLQSEPVSVNSREWPARASTLRRHGATPEEMEFLRTTRVELNAMTSPGTGRLHRGQAHRDWGHQAHSGRNRRRAARPPDFRGATNRAGDRKNFARDCRAGADGQAAGGLARADRGNLRRAAESAMGRGSRADHMRRPSIDSALP